MANETLEERKLKVLEEYIDYEKTRDSSRFVPDDDAMSAARELGGLKSKMAVPLLVQCIIITNSYDAGKTFQRALETIGRPALATIETAIDKSGFGGFHIYPGGPARGSLVVARENIRNSLLSQK